MASYNELLALIDAYINQNGVQAITGQVLNGVLRAMVDQLGRGYSIMGAADPTTDPGTPDGPETWFASVPGTYTNFDGIQIVDGELALLSYVPSTGFSKNTIYEGFQTVQATIDGNVGTPAVGVSYANGILSFDFHNMKGNPGNDGAPAGFGTVNATVDDQVGTPSVSVSSSGPDTAKNFTFAFRNLKGNPGVTSVLATVDNTSGNPQCTVSLQNGQLTLAFTGLKGAQGDTGSSVDYPYELVNNLTTNDATKGLSAAQGYVLDGKVSQLEAEVDENGMVLDAGIVPTRNIFLPSRKAVGLFIDGTDYGNTGYTTFFGILVEPSTKYVLSFDSSAHQYFRIRSKDANGQYIVSSYQAGGYDYTTPANAKFVDLCFGDNTINGVSIQLEKVSVTPYIYPIKATDDLVVSEQANGLVGLPAGTKEDASFTNETLTMTDYPEMAKVSGCLSFSGNVTAFDTIQLGTNPFSTYGRIFCKITTTHIIFGTGIRTPQEIAYFKHGLTISTFIRGTFSWYDGHLEANIFTLGGSFHCEYDDRLRDIYGYPYVQAPSGTTLTNFRVSISNERFQCPVWIFGDSYISISNNRWPYYLYKQYNIKDFFLCGFAGGDSSEVYPMLVQALKYGCPKYIVWALGMNDKDGDGVPNESWRNIFDTISRVCKDLGIVFIPATIPCVPTDTCENAYKDAYVLANASRIWNAASDVGALNDTTWYEGLLSDDNVHPSVLGAQALAGSLLTQVPELMQYRAVKRYGDAVGRNESLKNEMLTLSVSGKATDCYHNITATGETQILKSNLDLALVSEMYVDDLKITKSLTYNFTTTGIHKVSIVFVDNTKIPGNSISGLSTLVRVKVGNEVETIDAWAIWGNSSLTDLAIGPKVISIGYAGFHNSSSLERIYCLGKVCPFVASGGAFGRVKVNGKVFHLVDSYDFTDFVSTETNMLGAAGWTLQELVSNIQEFGPN